MYHLYTYILVITLVLANKVFTSSKKILFWESFLKHFENNDAGKVKKKKSVITKLTSNSLIPKPKEFHNL